MRTFYSMGSNLVTILAVLGTASLFSSNSAAQINYQQNLKHLRQLNEELRKEKKIVDSLDKKLNQTEERTGIELKLNEIAQAMNNQNEGILALERERKLQEQDIFQKYAEQSLQIESARLDRDLALSKFKKDLDGQRSDVELLKQRADQFNQSGIDSDERVRTQGLYQQRLEELGQSETQYQNLELQQRQDDELQQRRQQWQDRSDHERLQQEFQSRLQEAHQRYQNLESEYEKLQQRLTAQQTESDQLDQEYLQHRRRYDELDAQYDREIAQANQLGLSLSQNQNRMGPK